MDHIFVETETVGFTVAEGTEHQSWDLFTAPDRPSDALSECLIRGPGGWNNSLLLRPAPFRCEVWDNATRWVLVGQVQVREPGAHTIICRTDRGARYGLWQGDHARATEDMFFTGLGRSAVIGSDTLVIGITLIVANSVSRSAARRRSAASGLHAPPRPPWEPPPAAHPSAALPHARPPGPASHGEPATGTGPWQPPEPPPAARPPVPARPEALDSVPVGSHSRRYGDDVLAGDWRRPRKGSVPEVPVEPGLVLESADEGFCGAVVAWDKRTVTLEDRGGRRRVFELAPAGFLVDGAPVTVVRPASAPAGPLRSASGSLAVHGARPRVARESRIYVEGAHDAELVERVWGHDLRVEGVAVEYLEGVDRLPEIVAEFAPGPRRRLGVLVDHFVPGSKESRIAEQVRSEDVLVVGHPYIDVWEAVKPAAVGIRAWPRVPRGVPWKEGALAALSWRMETGDAWRRILGSVRSYADLEPELLGRVEELIDFVTIPRTTEE